MKNSFDRRKPAPRPTGPTAVNVYSAGAAVADITARLRYPFGGFSIIGQSLSKGVCGRLFATVLVVDDGQGTRVAFVAADLHVGTRYITEKVARELPVELGFGVDRIMIGASHTHYASGGVYGDTMYDKRAGSKGGFSRPLANWISHQIADAVKAACEGLTPARVGFGEDVEWGITANRSLEAFKLNGGDYAQPKAFARRFLRTGQSLPNGLSSEMLAVDPRVRVIWAERSDNGAPIGAIATFPAHSSGLDPLRGLISSDTLGYAARAASKSILSDTTFWGSAAPTRIPVGVAVSNAADANVFDPSVGPGRTAEATETDPDLSIPRALGERIGNVIVSACRSARSSARGDSTIQALFNEPRPSAAPNLADDPGVGVVSMGASEFGHHHLRRMNTASAKFALAISEPEGTTNPTPDPGDPHRPKFKLGGGLPGKLAGDPPDRLPLRIFRMSSKAWVVSVPFEVTTAVGQRIEAALCALPNGPEHVFLLSVAGAYASYVTTTEEYEWQSYEGSSTLWGRETGPWLLEQLQQLGAAASTPRPTARPLRFTKKTKKFKVSGKSIPRPPLNLVATYRDGVLEGSWQTTQRACPHFGPTPWLVVFDGPANDRSAKPLELHGLPLDDQNEDFRITRGGVRKRGPRRWTFRWAIPAADRALFEDPLRILSIALLPQQFCPAGPVRVDIE